MWDGALEDGAGVHQVLNVLTQHEVLWLELQVLLLHRVHSTRQIWPAIHTLDQQYTAYTAAQSTHAVLLTCIPMLTPPLDGHF